jgi:hypothetical protein
MAWIESHQALGHHPKTLRLAAELGCSLPTAVGHLQYLWWWSLDYAPDGVLKPGSEATVARACEWRGRVERFWKALVSAGFVEPLDGGAQIHDWREYAGRYIDRRRRDAERKRTSRQQGSDPSGKGSGGHPADVHGMSARTNQPDQPDQPPVGPGIESPARARAPDEPAARRALPQDCPICRRTFIGPYNEHECAPINRPPRSLGGLLGRPGKLSREELKAAEAELEQMRDRGPPAELPPDLAAQDARLRAAERAQSNQEPA